MFDLEEVYEKLSVLPRGFADNVFVAFTWIPDKAILGPCLAWKKSHNNAGYPYFKYGDAQGAHQASYIAVHGDYDRLLVIDHECNNNWCVNPYHLSAITQSENLARRRRDLAPLPESPCSGAYWDRFKNKWRAHPNAVHAGYFDTAEEACAKVKEVRGY